MTLVSVTCKMGVYRHDEFLDLIDDLGGYIIQKQAIAQEVVLQALVPKEDIAQLRVLSRVVAGEIQYSPLVGTEIAVVSMSLDIHHLPHASCDMGEYLRKSGAKTNMIGLARGFGKRIGLLSAEERDIINEHDLVIFLFGNFETCIKYKIETFRRGIFVPIVLCGGPKTEVLRDLFTPPVDGYLGNIGRFMHRTQEKDEIAKLDELIAEVSRVLDEKRTRLARDPLSMSPARLMDVILDEVPEIHNVLSPIPVVVQMDGVRIKLPYEKYHDVISAVVIEGEITIGDVVRLTPSKMQDYILAKILPMSETGIMI
ncbi:MAG: methanogenesis marker 7 protein [Euryarchaeota archaeon]|nr:methanogenesis marker 7 protein [Euryarchaeota archaeon]